MNWILFLLVLIAGAATSIQASANGALGKKIGIIEAALVSFSSGTIFLLVIYLFNRKGNLHYVLDVPKWNLIGGILGATYIMIMVTSVPRIGLAAALITLIGGQILFSSLIDHFGWFGIPSYPINMKRAFAIFLMFISVYMFYKR